MKRRASTQPGGRWTAGSTFKNPPGDHAGRLIESCGLKGFAVGGARVSELHANFILNDGSATAGDVAALIRLVQREIRSLYGVRLELEPHLWS